MLLTSTQLIENLTHFTQERIPERSVHAKAAGDWGTYEVTDDISDLTDAAFLNGLGKKTDVLVRVSTMAPWVLDLARWTPYAISGDSPSSLKPLKEIMTGCLTIKCAIPKSLSE